MMENTLCLLFVLALIAQICAMPADYVDAEKDTARAADHANGLKDESAKGASDAMDKATKGASDASDKARKGASDAKDKATKGASDAMDKTTKGASDAMDKAMKGATDGANKVTGAADEAKNKGGHGVANHGGKDCNKLGTGSGPMTGAIKATEEVGKKFVDASVNVVKDLLDIFRM